MHLGSFVVVSGSVASAILAPLGTNPHASKRRRSAARDADLTTSGRIVVDASARRRARSRSPSRRELVVPRRADSKPRARAHRQASSATTAAALRAQLVAQLEHRIELEATIAAISTRFVGADPGSVEVEIEHALGRVGRFIGTDRALMYRFAPDGSAAHLVHDWQSVPQKDAEPALMQIRRADAPEVLDFFLAKNRLNAPRPETLPPGFAQLNELPGVARVQSRISVPVVQDNRAVGILCFHSLVAERHWLEEDLGLLGLLGEIIGNALARADAEDAIQRARQIAEAANRAKTEFLASMSHELRTPLNGILGYAQLLRLGGSLKDADAESVAAIERNGEHLLKLINDILDLAKIEAERFEIEATDFSLTGLLTEVADVARIHAHQSGLEFRNEIDAQLPARVIADARRLRQVLLNLLGNAVKFTHSGSVTLRVSSAPHDGGAILRFEVEDTGRGIAPDDLQGIFEPFRQVRDPTHPAEGTGLGLAISRKLIDLMGGTLHVRSELDVGSVFAFELDVATNDSVAADALPATARAIGYRGARRTALVVDDMRDNRRVLESFLSSIGFDVQVATDGTEAVAAAADHRPDIVFMDLVMPKLNGFDATRAIRAQPDGASVPMVAVSADAFDQTRQRSDAAGFDAFITKPLRFDSVLAVIEQLLHLDWIYAVDDRAVARRQTGTSGEFDVHDLPRDVVRELLNLARIGDVQALARRVSALPAVDHRFEGLAGKLATLTRQYDLRSVATMLEAASIDRA
jgi:signal transduction histidine kinase/DNA-binding NarL/FixJ family response regulator